MGDHEIQVYLNHLRGVSEVTKYGVTSPLTKELDFSPASSQVKYWAPVALTTCSGRHVLGYAPAQFTGYQSKGFLHSTFRRRFMKVFCTEKRIFRRCVGLCTIVMNLPSSLNRASFGLDMACAPMSSQGTVSFWVSLWHWKPDCYHSATWPFFKRNIRSFPQTRFHFLTSEMCKDHDSLLGKTKASFAGGIFCLGPRLSCKTSVLLWCWRQVAHSRNAPYPRDSSLLPRSIMRWPHFSKVPIISIFPLVKGNGPIFANLDSSGPLFESAIF